MPRAPDRKLCGVCLAAPDFDRIRARAIRQGKDPDRAVRARLDHGGTCTRPAMPNSDRCIWHGAYSVGPRSVEGMQRCLAGRAAWLAARRSAGLPMTMGRKPAGKNRSRQEIEAEKIERALRRQERLARIDRKRAARRQVQELAELDQRREQFHAGLPFFADDELPDKAAVGIMFDSIADGQVPPGPQATDVAIDAVQLVDQAMAALQEAATHGVHLTKSDVLALEADFLDRCAAGGLPVDLLERIHDLLMGEEARIDTGSRADLIRRAKLESAYLSALAGNTVPGNAALPVTDNAGPPADPVAPPVSDFASYDTQTAEDAALRRAYEITEAIVGRYRDALRVPPSAPAGPYFLGGLRRRP